MNPKQTTNHKPTGTLRITIDIDQSKITRWGSIYFCLRPKSQYGSQVADTYLTCEPEDNMLPGFEWDEPKSGEPPVFTFKTQLITGKDDG